jgi:hypothetical protein
MTCGTSLQRRPRPYPQPGPGSEGRRPVHYQSEGPAFTTGYRVTLQDAKPEMPQICVVTGEPATLLRPIEGFTSELVAFSPHLLLCRMRRTTVQVPFSDQGWYLYRKHYPLFWRVFECGLRVVSYIPLIGLLDLTWTMLCFSYLWWLPVVEFLRGKRRLCRGHFAFAYGRCPSRLDISVCSREFANAFQRANPGATVLPHMIGFLG